MKALEYLITAVRSAPGLKEVRRHAPSPGSNEYLIYEVSNEPKGLRQWWEGALLREFQAALHDRQLLSGMPGLHFNCY